MLRYRALVGVIPLVLMLGACSQGSEDAPAADGRELPISSAFVSSGEDAKVSSAAMTAVQSRCMRAKGFTVPPEDGALVEQSNDFTYPEYPETDAQLDEYINGLRNPPSEESASPETKKPGYNEALMGNGELYHVELGGREVTFPKNGCISEATLAVYGDVEGYRKHHLVNSELQGLMFRARTAADKKPEVSGARDKYQKCLDAKNLKPFGTPDQSKSPDQVSADARARFECKKQTDLVKTVRVAIQAEERKLVQENQGILTQAKEDRDALITRCRNILASS